MCGIVGYIGNKPVYDILINGLKKLEYRGYDSSGVMIYDDKLLIKKSKGKVSALENLFSNENDKNGTIGIGHTRWATHGPPNQVNSHPHISNSGEISLVHNGIIENYASIKKILVKKGYTFSSDTASEVLVNLIEDEAAGFFKSKSHIRPFKWGVFISFDVHYFVGKKPCFGSKRYKICGLLKGKDQGKNSCWAQKGYSRLHQQRERQRTAFPRCRPSLIV